LKFIVRESEGMSDASVAGIDGPIRPRAPG
jgi:hypothetical protein